MIAPSIAISVNKVWEEGRDAQVVAFRFVENVSQFRMRLFVQMKMPANTPIIVIFSFVLSVAN